jgi:hypothetical protein
MKRTFKIIENDELEMLGFLEVGAPSEFEPLAPMGTAHDCLEHFKGDDGSIDHEFMALGCMLYIRGEGGYWNEPYEKNCSMELSATLWRYYEQGYKMRDPASNRIEISESIQLVCEYARKGIPDEHHAVDRSRLRLFLEAAAYWLQVGYNRAIRKYPNRYQACDVFREIEYQLGKVLQVAQEYDMVEVQYIMTTRYVNVKLFNHEYEY